MKITDPAVIDVIMNGESYGELADGLFTVVGQQYLIEMHTQAHFAEVPGLELPECAFIIRTSDVLVNDDPFNDGLMNSSYTVELDVGLNDFFNQHIEHHIFDNQEEAMQFYFGFITQHNHLS